MLQRIFARISSRLARAARLPRRLTLTREGLYYLGVLVAVFAGATVRDSNLMLLLGGMLAGPLLLSLYFVVRGLQHVTLERHLPEGVCAGDPLTVELVCTNRRKRLAGWALLAEDAFQYSGPLVVRRGTPGRVLFPFVPPGEASRAVYEGLPPVRGRYVFGPLRLATRFPLGLIRQEKSLARPATLLVWPRLGRLTPDGLKLEQQGDLGGQKTDRRQSRREADFYGLRDWRSGDSRRWIHWRSTARRGQIVVRQFDESRNQDLSLFLDLWQVDRDDRAGRERVEAAISFAATLLADTCRRGGRRLMLHASADTSIHLQGWATPILLREVLDALAVAMPRGNPELPGDFVDALAEIRPPLAAVLISTRPLELAALRASDGQAPAAIAAGKVQLVDVGSGDLARYFESVG